MFYSNQNAGNNKPSINTHIDTFFGSLSYLQLSAWDDKISFTWVPVAGQAENGRRMYDKDNKVSTGLTHPKIDALLVKYEKELRDKIIAGEDPGENGICVGVPVRSGRGDNSTISGIFIEYMRGTNGPEVFFTLGKGLTENGASAVCRYKFESIQTVSGTSAEKGNFTSGKTEGEFFWFINLIKAHAAIARYGEHSRKLADQFMNRGGNGGNQGGFGNTDGMDMSAMNTPDTADGFQVFN